VVDANADPTGVGRLVVDAVGDRLAQIPVDEVVDVDGLGLSRGLPLPPAVAESADKLLLLGIHGDDRLPLLLIRLDTPVDMLELSITVGMITTFDRLAIRLEAVPRGVEQPVDRPLAHAMPLGLEFGRQVGRTLARPPQWRHRVATGHRIDQDLEGTLELRVVLGQRLPPGPLPPCPPRRGQGVGGRRGIKFLQARPDGDAGQPGGLGDPRDPTPPDRMGLSRRPEAPSPLVEHWLQGRKLLGDDLGEGMCHWLIINVRLTEPSESRTDFGRSHG
jgi:hypothetical protein